MTQNLRSQGTDRSHPREGVSWFEPNGQPSMQVRARRDAAWAEEEAAAAARRERRDSTNVEMAVVDRSAGTDGKAIEGCTCNRKKREANLSQSVACAVFDSCGPLG